LTVKDLTYSRVRKVGYRRTITINARGDGGSVAIRGDMMYKPAEGAEHLRGMLRKKDENKYKQEKKPNIQGRRKEVHYGVTPNQDTRLG